MFKHVISTMIILAAGTVAFAQAGARNVTLQDGSYEVEVRLELTNLEGAAAKKTASICVSGVNGNGYHGLVVLSAYNPLATCPVTNIRQDGNTLTFDIVCEGANAARASATYTLAAQHFQGWIAMKMGGKDMTMTEIQRGRRVGECEVPSHPRS